MKVSIIITAHDLERFQDTVAAIGSVLSQEFSFDKEIIVVVDRNKEFFERLTSLHIPMINIILNGNAGLSNSRNEGIKNSKGEIIVFMDDDAVADKMWLSNIVRNYDSSKIIGVGGRLNPLWLDDKERWFPEELFWIIGCNYKGYPETKCAVRNTFGGNISFRRHVFRDFAFDSKMGRNGKIQLTSDETELSIKLLSRYPGKVIIYDPEAVVYHRIYSYRLTLKYVIKRAFGDGVSKHYIAMNHKSSALSTENRYLISILTKSLPQEVSSILIGPKRIVAIKRIILDLIVIATVGVGYLWGSFKWRL